MRTLVLLLAGLLASCGSSDKEPDRRAFDNQQALNTPEVIGRLPDGRILYHSQVRLSGVTTPQQIFYAGSDMTLNTVSLKVPVSRTLVGEVKDVVILDGQRYDAAEVKQALVRDEDQRRKETK